RRPRKVVSRIEAQLEAAGKINGQIKTSTTCDRVLEVFMAIAEVKTTNGMGGESDSRVVLASLLVGAGFFALWFWLLPAWLGFHVDTTGAARWRWLAIVPSVLGFAVAIRCIWDFGRTGRGTPAPMAPPKKLVVVGFYRYVRNPM